MQGHSATAPGGKWSAASQHLAISETQILRTVKVGRDEFQGAPSVGCSVQLSQPCHPTPECRRLQTSYIEAFELQKKAAREVVRLVGDSETRMADGGRNAGRL
ncbi:uncharacterized protein APUU_30447A [Aspergillus puulaauensis]|uniref:Uncharacterized protein n=1 Tax=Aspergillus puulaauensis TaxID=1220207 RepID=A0A7R7XIM3_9EURO|nr:uncharacterized protein APUU_30447A [Aspergillus puulaauensis]BCS22222.1 hypothetical protein APUU_30447A [Aspergillus puulaauensis]